ASLAITARLRLALAAGGAGAVRPSYLPVLMSLWQEDGLRVSDLTRRAGLEPSTMTTLLDRMERDGLLGRRLDPDDRRAQRVFLTSVAGAVHDAALAAVDECLTEVLAGVGPERLETLMEALRTVLTNTERGVARD
ncbi:MAG: MarR family transcriptional regulator, partial [Acidobacteriota bacterium]